MSFFYESIGPLLARAATALEQTDLRTPEDERSQRQLRGLRTLLRRIGAIYPGLFSALEEETEILEATLCAAISQIEAQGLDPEHEDPAGGPLDRYSGLLGALDAMVILLQTQWEGVAAWPFGLRALASAFPSAAVAFVMGCPFPQGIIRIHDRGPGVVAWAWGINGFASVVGALSATLIAMHLGFRVLAVCAGTAYLLAGLVGRRVGSSR